MSHGGQQSSPFLVPFSDCETLFTTLPADAACRCTASNGKPQRSVFIVTATMLCRCERSATCPCNVLPKQESIPGFATGSVNLNNELSTTHQGALIARTSWPIPGSFLFSRFRDQRMGLLDALNRKHQFCPLLWFERILIFLVQYAKLWRWVCSGWRPQEKGITIYNYIFNGEFKRNLIRFVRFILTKKSYFYLILTSSGALFLRLIFSVKLYADVNLIFSIYFPSFYREYYSVIFFWAH